MFKGWASATVFDFNTHCRERHVSVRESVQENNNEHYNVMSWVCKLSFFSPYFAVCMCSQRTMHGAGWRIWWKKARWETKADWVCPPARSRCHVHSYTGMYCPIHFHIHFIWSDVVNVVQYFFYNFFSSNPSIYYQSKSISRKIQFKYKVQSEFQWVVE